MTPTTAVSPKPRRKARRPRWTVAELLKRLGGIPAERVLLHPPPGTATFEDLVEQNEYGGALCELIDGTLVEKAVGFDAAYATGRLMTYLTNYVIDHPIAHVLPPDLRVQATETTYRVPDISVFLFADVGETPAPASFMPTAPALAIEVLSSSNRRGEMTLKRTELFAAGTREFWIVDPDHRDAEYHFPDRPRVQIPVGGTLTSPDLLPGFSVELERLFVPGRPARPRRRRRS